MKIDVLKRIKDRAVRFKNVQDSGDHLLAFGISHLVLSEVVLDGSNDNRDSKSAE